MEIEDAFTQEAIAAVGVGDDREDEIRDVIRSIYSANELELTRDHENVAVLCFVAGRVYQTDEESEQSTFLMPMDQPMMAEFIGFLMEKRGT